MGTAIAKPRATLETRGFRGESETIDGRLDAGQLGLIGLEQAGDAT